MFAVETQTETIEFSTSFTESNFGMYEEDWEGAADEMTIENEPIADPDALLASRLLEYTNHHYNSAGAEITEPTDYTTETNILSQEGHWVIAGENGTRDLTQEIIATGNAEWIAKHFEILTSLRNNETVFDQFQTTPDENIYANTTENFTQEPHTTYVDAYSTTTNELGQNIILVKSLQIVAKETNPVVAEEDEDIFLPEVYETLKPMPIGEVNENMAPVFQYIQTSKPIQKQANTNAEKKSTTTHETKDIKNKPMPQIIVAKAPTELKQTTVVTEMSANQNLDTSPKQPTTQDTVQTKEVGAEIIQKQTLQNAQVSMDYVHTKQQNQKVTTTKPRLQEHTRIPTAAIVAAEQQKTNMASTRVKPAVTKYEQSVSTKTKSTTKEVLPQSVQAFQTVKTDEQNKRDANNEARLSPTVPPINKLPHANTHPAVTHEPVPQKILRGNEVAEITMKPSIVTLPLQQEKKAQAELHNPEEPEHQTMATVLHEPVLNLELPQWDENPLNEQEIKERTADKPSGNTLPVSKPVTKVREIPPAVLHVKNFEPKTENLEHAYTQPHAEQQQSEVTEHTHTVKEEVSTSSVQAKNNLTKNKEQQTKVQHPAIRLIKLEPTSPIKQTEKQAITHEVTLNETENNTQATIHSETPHNTAPILSTKHEREAHGIAGVFAKNLEQDQKPIPVHTRITTQGLKKLAPTEFKKTIVPVEPALLARLPLKNKQTLNVTIPITATLHRKNEHIPPTSRWSTQYAPAHKIVALRRLESTSFAPKQKFTKNKKSRSVATPHTTRQAIRVKPTPTQHTVYSDNEQTTEKNLLTIAA